MNHIFIFKAAHHMDNRVALADVCEELVAESLALACAAHQSRDVDKLNDGGRHFFRVVHLAESLDARIRHRDHADIRVDGAERIVGGLGTGLGQGVKKRTFSDIRKSDNTEFHRQESPLMFCE